MQQQIMARRGGRAPAAAIIPPAPARRTARRFTRVAAVALAMALAGPALAARQKSEPRPAAPKDNRVWLIARADDTLVLRYGAPGAADPVFAVACQPSAGLLQFTVEVSSAKIRPGDGAALSLVAGKRHLELAASTFRGATDGQVVAEAAVALDDRVLDLFADGDSLTVRLPGSSSSFPLAGAKPKLADFRRGCQGRR